MRLIEMSAASRRIHFGTSGSAPLGSPKALDRRWSFDHISLPIRRLTLSKLAPQLIGERIDSTKDDVGATRAIAGVQ